jgi:hypothetical protein
MPEYLPKSLQLLLKEDSPSWPPLFFATCHVAMQDWTLGHTAARCECARGTPTGRRVDVWLVQGHSRESPPHACGTSPEWDTRHAPADQRGMVPTHAHRRRAGRGFDPTGTCGGIWLARQGSVGWFWLVLLVSHGVSHFLRRFSARLHGLRPARPPRVRFCAGFHLHHLSFLLLHTTVSWLPRFLPQVVQEAKERGREALVPCL